MSMMASTSLSVSGRESCSLYGCSDSITWGGLHPPPVYHSHAPTRLHIQSSMQLSVHRHCQYHSTTPSCFNNKYHWTNTPVLVICHERGHNRVTYASNYVVAKSRVLSGHLGGDCRGGCSPFPTSRRCTSLTSRRWAATPPSCSSCSEADVTMIGMPPPHRALSVSAAAPPCQAKTTG